MLHPLILAEALRRQRAALEGWNTRKGTGASSPTWLPACCSSSGSKLPLLCLRGWRRRCSPLESLLSKTALHVQCKVAGKDWCWNVVFQQHQNKTCLKAFCMQFSACEEFQILQFFSWFWIWALSIFSVKTFPCPARPHPIQLHQQLKHHFKWSVASATGLTQLPGTLFHGLNAFVLLF